MARKPFSIILACLIALFVITSIGHVIETPAQPLQQQNRPIVQLFYIRSSDRAPEPDIDAKIVGVVKQAQQFFADEMERHGFSRKTFLLETDATGNPVVHHVDNRGQVQSKKGTYQFIVNSRASGDGLGGSEGFSNGFAEIYYEDGGLNWDIAAHELGHAFGLAHDFRHNTYLMSYGGIDGIRADRLSKCNAEWLDVHRAFTPGQPPVSENKSTHIEMLPPRFVSSPNAIRLRFKVTDPDGIHQVLLFAPGHPTGIINQLQDCKLLNGKTNETVEFVTNVLTAEAAAVGVRVLDVHGNWSGSVRGDWFGQTFHINDIASFLSPIKVVLIPDARLAHKVRKSFSWIGGEYRNPSDAWTLTSHVMLDLTHLDVRNYEITDLTGLEHAINLTKLNLGGEYISGKGYTNSNAITDFSPLSKLTRLKTLNLRGIFISDVGALTSALLELTNLTSLDLSSTSISDMRPLKNLTQLRLLHLFSNMISDVGPLAALTRLQTLHLSNNAISNVSALADLTQLASLSLGSNSITDVSSLANLTQLTNLHLSNNAITDVQTLAGLTQLTVLDLRYNTISDVSPLVGLDLTGTEWNSTGLYLEGNPLNYASLHTHIPTMQTRGIEVTFDPRPYPALDIISGRGQQTAGGGTLANPFIVAAIDERGTPMRGVAVTFVVIEGVGELTATNATTDATGRAKTTLTVEPNSGRHRVLATAPTLGSSVTFTTISTAPEARLAADVNGDGVVNIQDLVVVSSYLGQIGQNVAEVNGDGVVNIQDLVLVAGELGTDTAAPSAWHRASGNVPSRATVEQWLIQAYHSSLTDVRSQRGIFLLERLLAALAPKETALLTNYPNPFNPETWVPYQLAKPTEVTLTIYAVDGRVVRQLTLGHQPAGMYHNKKRAAYWDGRNEVGEAVASGVYFYTLTTADDFTATRKMLIRK